MTNGTIGSADSRHNRLGIAMGALAAQRQKGGTESFVKSWNEMVKVVARKAKAFK